MPEFKFEEKDFDKAYSVGDDGGDELYMHLIIRVANAKLEAWLAAAPVVWGHQSKKDNEWWMTSYGKEMLKDTHKAKLIQIEELPGATEGSDSARV